MSVAFLMLFVGFVLVVAGWDNISVWDALRGHFDVAKPASGTYTGKAGG